MLNRLFGSQSAALAPPDITFGVAIKAGVATPITLKASGQSGEALEGQIRARRELRADPTGLALAAAAHPIAHRCIDLRSRKISEMPRRLVKKSDNSIVEDHPLWRAVEWARHYWGNDLFYLWQYAKCVHGECYLEKVRDQFGRPFTLRWLSPVVTYPIIMGGRIQEFYYAQSNSGLFESFTPDEVIYDYYHNPLDDFRGLSPTQVALPSINTLVGIADYQNSYFQNDATPGGILSADGNTYIGKTDQDRLMKFWKDQLQGRFNRFRAIFMPSNVKWQSTQQPPTPEHDLVEQAAIHKISAAYGVPTPLVTPVATRTSQSLDEQMKIFYENTIIPECVEEARMVNQFILPWFDDTGELRYEHDFAKIRSLLEDQVNLATSVDARLLSGNMMIDEARAKFGDLPLPDGAGRVYFMPKAVLPVPEADMKDVSKIVQEAAQKPQQQGMMQENQTPVRKTDQQQNAMNELKLWRKLTFQKGLDRGRRFEARDLPAQLASDLKAMLYGISDLEPQNERDAAVEDAFADAERLMGHFSERETLRTMHERILEA